MCSFTPYQTTAQSMAEMFDRHESYRPGEKELVSSHVKSFNSGSGQGSHHAVFVYDDGSTEVSPPFVGSNS